MRLSELLEKDEYRTVNMTDLDITDIVYDSRKADSSKLFVCMTGVNSDGHDYAASAYEKGCRAFVAEKELALPSDAAIAYTDNSRRALAVLSAAFFGDPSDKLHLIGITGTKGKTTTAALIRGALEASGVKTGLIGTTGIYYRDKYIPVVNTTPESYVLQRAFAEMVSDGIEYVVLEVSSQAYLTHRVEGLEFDIGVFTNLSPDHIGRGEHPDFENYRSCKSKLFAHCKNSVINYDDENCEAMVSSARGSVYYYSFKNEKADLKGENIKLCRVDGTPGVRFEASFQNKFRNEDESEESLFEVKVRTPGEYSAYNAIAALAVCKILHLPMETALASLASTQIKGRFEIIDIDALPDRSFIIDYAHNALSLTNVLQTLRKYSPSRLVCLFGTVGGRTKLRRESLGKAAAENADFCIITSDNPDKENPLDIIEDIKRGFDKSDCPYIAIPDRAEAISYAVSHSRAGDIILFAGKGHENYQLIDGVHVPFCERDIIEKEALYLVRA